MHCFRRYLFLTAWAVLLASAPALAQDDDPDGDEADQGDQGDDDVTVEGQRARLDRSAAAVTAIEVDERLPESADVGDAVARAPGTTVRRLGGLGSYSAVSLRGSALRQVEVHLDGIPLNPDGSAAVNLAELPLRALERVEVWRGGGPAWLAAAPLGGVVNLVTRTDATAPTSLSVGAGSWGTLTGGVTTGAQRGAFDVLAGVSGLRTAGDYVYFDDNGTDGVLTDDGRPRRAWNDKGQVSAIVRLRHRGDRATTTGLVLGTVRDEGLPGPIGSGPDGRLSTAWVMGAGDYDVTLGATRVRVRGWGQLRDETLSPLEGGAATVERQGRVGLHGEVRHVFSDAFVGGATARVRHDVRAQPEPSDDVLPAYRWTGTAAADAAILVGERVRIEPVLHGQIYLDRTDRPVWNPARTRAVASPRVAAAWTPTDRLTLRAAAGRAVRPPDFLELFGDRGAVVGRSDLRPERGTWADVGVRYERPDDFVRFGGEWGLFHHYAVDRIVFVQNGQRTLVPVNIGRSTISGAELAFDMDARGWLDARAALTVNHSAVRNDDVPGLDDKRLPRIPGATVSADVGVRWGEVLRVSLQVDAITDNAWDAANRVVAPYRDLGAVAVRVQPGPEWPSVTAEVRNIANTTAAVMPLEPARPEGARVLRPITDFAGYPLPGRTVLVTLRWTLDGPRR